MIRESAIFRVIPQPDIESEIVVNAVGIFADAVG